MADPRGGSKMADAKIKKIIGNVTKLNFFHAYIVCVILTWKLLAIHQIVFIYTILVK